uniref:Coiled-coil domain-containing protein 162-like n=1 Tax=Cebus imitator TaxID=2715852 RepID=A0A2K5QI97_CEBIM
MFKTLPEKAAFKALKQTLQLIAPLHDIMAYFVSFSKVGTCPAWFEFHLSPNPLRGDWGGAEGIGSELQELQNMIDSLQKPQDPTRVAQALLLRTEVMFLQFDAAVRHRIRGTFLAAGNVPAYQSVTDNMYHGLPFHLPQPLDPWSLQAFELVPWRTFLEDGGPFPVMSSSPDTLEYNMQLCLCGLSDHDCKVAHGELVGVQLLLEDVLGSYHMTMEGPPRQQATLDWSKVPGFRSQFQSSPKASELLQGLCDAVMSLALLRSFLILWKQLQVPKEHWADSSCKARASTLSLHKQFSETDILYSSMKAIARQMGKEDEFEGFILQKLLEKFEIHMIQEVQRKVNREMTLVLSEKAKEAHCSLPILDLWKHQVMKESFSVSRPQIVEKCIQRLMQNYQDDGVEITFRRDHLEACLLSLGCDVMARERSNFETYCMCYEHVLCHARQRLSQKQQELDATQTGQGPPEDSAGQAAELSHDMIMEITALRAQLTDLEEVNLNLKKQIRKDIQEEYEALVQALLRPEKLDENQLNLIQKVCEKKWGSASPDEGMKENPAKEQLWALEWDNCSLATLVCKVRSLGRWRLAVQQACFQAQPSRSEKILLVKLKIWKGNLFPVLLYLGCLQEFIESQDLARVQAPCRLLSFGLFLPQAQLLKELEHRVTQKALTQQELDFMKTSSMEQLLEDVGQKEQQLQLLSEEAEKASKLGQLQQKTWRETMRAHLAKERSMKLDALQRVEDLQSQLHDAQQSAVPMGSPGGLTSQARYSPSSASTSSRYCQQHFLKTNLTGSKITGQIQRPQTVPIKHKKRIDDVFPPNMAENVHLTAFQVQTAPSRFPFRADW